MRAARLWTALAACVAVTAWAACGRNRSTTPDAADAVHQILGGNPPSPLKPGVWADVRRFYELRDDHPAWVANDRARVSGALAVLRSAPDHGLDSGTYGDGELATQAERIEHADLQTSDRLR